MGHPQPLHAFKNPLRFFSCLHQCETRLLDELEICPKKHWSIYIVTFLQGILVAKNAPGGGWVNFVFWCSCTVGWYLPSTTKLPSSENTPVSKLSFKLFSNEWWWLTSRYGSDVVPAVFTPVLGCLAFLPENCSRHLNFQLWGTENLTWVRYFRF